MRRRDFCAGIGSAALLSGSRMFVNPARAEETMAALRDPDPAGGYNLKPPSQFLFTDYRNVNPADIDWRGPDGTVIPVAGPPDPPVEAVADWGMVARGIRLVAQPAQKEGPIAGIPGPVVKDGDVYRAWNTQVNYAGANLGSYSKAAATSMVIVYSESKDGYAWDRRNTNEVKLSNVTGIDGGYFFIDPHGPADERYKCIYHAHVLSGAADLWQQYQKVHPRHRDVRLQADRINCLFGMTSADGLNWKPIPEPLLIHIGDTDNTVYYDEWLGKYVLYTRLFWMQRRMIARAESDDFRHWTPVEPIIWPSLNDPPSYDVYTNGRTCYPGLPSQHLMFPIFYRKITQTSEVHLYSSFDGIHWDRVPGGPILAPGHPGDWDAEFIVAGKNLIPLGKDRIAIPYSGSTHPHKYPRWPGVIKGGGGYAWWPKGRLCALTADEEGEFTTFWLQVTGKQLKFNARVRRAGEIRVGLWSIDGRSVHECDPFTGDSFAHTVTWKGDNTLRVDPGNGTLLHFRLRAAELFGFEWS